MTERSEARTADRPPGSPSADGEGRRSPVPARSWKKAIKRWPGWLALGLVALVLLAVGTSQSSGPRTPDERLEYISTRLKCPICEGESVFESRNSDSEAIRTEIRSQISQGQLSDDQIITYMTDRYGEQLLLVPKASGIDALVWVLPVAAAICAVVGLAFAFRRWRRTVDTIPDDEDRARVDAARSGAEPDEAVLSRPD